MFSRCWLAELLDLDECDGRIDKAHIGLTERYLRTNAIGPRLSKDDANDSRLLRPICRKHHSELDNPNCDVDLQREHLPESVWEYAAEHSSPKHNLTARLDFLYPEAA